MKKIFLFFIILATVSVSCTKDFEDLNTDKKNPTEVPANTLFTNAQKNLADQIASTNVNLNVWKLFSQYWTETTYIDESNYDIINRTIADNAFRVLYRDILVDFKEADRLIRAETTETDDEATANANKLLIIDMLMVYTYHRTVDIYGNIPYSEALDIETTISPKYDDAATIYSDLFSRLTTDLTNLNVDGESFGDADIFYHGNVAAWIKFGYSLQLKMGIHLADLGGVAQAKVEEAAPLAFTSSDDDCELVYLGSTPNTNPLHVDLVLSGRKDFVPANTIVDIMNDRIDPRLLTYFESTAFIYDKEDNVKIDTELPGEGKMVLIYQGGESLVQVDLPFVALAVDSLNTFSYTTGGIYGFSNSYANFSHISEQIQVPEFPVELISYTEIQFYLAEAAAREWSVGGDAESFYNAGITNSFMEWGGTGAAEYLAQENVAYTTATATATWQEVIATQSWLASYTRGFIGWTTWRRLDFPILNIPEAPETDDGQVPKRFTYPVNEQTLNATNYYNAVGDMGGTDLMSDKLFWDIH